MLHIVTDNTHPTLPRGTLLYKTGHGFLRVGDRYPTPIAPRKRMDPQHPQAAVRVLHHTTSLSTCTTHEATQVLFRPAYGPTVTDCRQNIVFAHNKLIHKTFCGCVQLAALELDGELHLVEHTNHDGRHFARTDLCIGYDRRPPRGSSKCVAATDLLPIVLPRDCHLVASWRPATPISNEGIDPERPPEPTSDDTPRMFDCSDDEARAARHAWTQPGSISLDG